MDTREAGGHRQFCLPKFAHVRLSRASEVHQRNFWIFPIFKCENRLGTTDPSNDSLYPIKPFSSSSPEESCGGNQQNPSITNDLHDLPQWFHVFATSLVYIYTHVIVNRQGHHNIRNGTVWAQTGHSTGTCTATLCV